MGRRRDPRGSQPIDTPAASEGTHATTKDWTIWRPRRHVGLLVTSLLLLLAWIGFLLAMIRLK